MSAQEPGPADEGLCARPDHLRLIIRAAELLFVHGETTEGVRRTAERLGLALGLRVQLTARWGELRVQADESTFGAETLADPVAVDISVVKATEHVVDRVCEHRIEPRAALGALDDIARMPPVGLLRFMTLAGAGAAALAVIFGATDALTICLTAMSAGLGACLRRFVSRLSHNSFLQPFAASLLAGIIVALSGILQLPVSLHLLAACPCMVLVPGPHFLNGAIDLVRARISLGMARILFASMIVIAISAGLFIGLSFGTTKFVSSGSATVVPFIYDLLAAGVAVAAYGAFFNMPWRMLPVPICIGMVAHALRWYFLASGGSAPMGALLACTFVGACTAPLAHRLHVPFGASAFAAVVSLVPGIFMFQTVADALVVIGQGSAVQPAVLAEIAGNIVSITMILLAMTAGLIVPRMIFEDWLSASKLQGNRK